MKDASLLMTSCIAPASQVSVRRDPAQREADVIGALEMWFKKWPASLGKLVFVDNSSHALGRVEAMLRSSCPVPFVVVRANECPLPGTLHYGYGELDMLDQVFSSGVFDGTDSYVVKVTGRLYFPGLERLLVRINLGCNFVLDGRQTRFGRGRRYIDTRLMIFRPHIYQECIQGKKEMMRGADKSITHMEHVVYEAIKGRMDGLLRFPVNCDPVGIGGAKGVAYGTTTDRIKSVLRSITRVVAPAVWI